MTLPSLSEIQESQSAIYRSIPPTPQHSWPLLNQRLGCEAWVKHENHTQLGAFKIRGALLYVEWLKKNHPEAKGVVAATRGNHGQGVAYAASQHGLTAVIVVPHGNGIEKNLAMRAQGAELIEHGEDFQASLEFARTLAEERGYPLVDSFHEQLIRGTSTFALELFNAAPSLDTVYVPIGMGSSISGVAAARNALGLNTRIVGVVSSASPSYLLSYRAGTVIEAPSVSKIADGLSCRRPNEQAVEILRANAAEVIEVTDAEIAGAIRMYLEDTHNLAEGAGAAALAGALKQQDSLAGKKIGLILTGGNIDQSLLTTVLKKEI
jgi:threonine dehydratase